ncbi:hypothetical protein WN51_03384 [Melipona quadrifasciata]|uniref:Uncharacterized protein n=1 Tax=Melipona quadrifasciata TaxID=166423 RepID=A0A0M8ZTR0_9HYME|nr:hypothetical protein WN51_03384 [Melipona quadrifasciata]
MDAAIVIEGNFTSICKSLRNSHLDHLHLDSLKLLQMKVSASCGHFTDARHTCNLTIVSSSKIVCSLCKLTEELTLEDSSVTALLSFVTLAIKPHPQLRATTTKSIQNCGLGDVVRKTLQLIRKLLQRRKIILSEIIKQQRSNKVRRFTFKSSPQGEFDFQNGEYDLQRGEFVQVNGGQSRKSVKPSGTVTRPQNLSWSKQGGEPKYKCIMMHTIRETVILSIYAESVFLAISEISDEANFENVSDIVSMNLSSWHILAGESTLSRQPTIAFSRSYRQTLLVVTTFCGQAWSRNLNSKWITGGLSSRHCRKLQLVACINLKFLNSQVLNLLRRSLGSTSFGTHHESSVTVDSIEQFSGILRSSYSDYINCVLSVCAEYYIIQ